MAQIPPHGGVLIDRIVEGEEREALEDRVGGLKKVKLDARETSDLEMIATGGFSPLEGFMNREDYESVLDNKRLSNSLPWTIPITLAVSDEEAEGLREGSDVALVGDEGAILGVLHLEERYRHGKRQEAVQIYRTDDEAHPGVAYVYGRGDILLGGRVSVLRRPKHRDFVEYRMDPIETRRLFNDRGWRRIVAFQTRNPVHRAHEYIQKCALETMDGLLLHPLVGQTKEGDLPSSVRVRSYEVILAEYYPKDRTVLAVCPMAMRYAGPREAIFHAIVRKNYGCTHFIVGRDHAGVGNYYGPFDAHYIFDEFEPEELGITPMFFDYTFYCKRCSGVVSSKTCPHSPDQHVSLSGTEIRGMLSAGKAPPPELTRPEVAKVLIEGFAQSKQGDEV